MLKISISKSATQRFVKTTSAALKDATFANVDIYIKTQNHLNKTVAQNVVKVTNISKTSYNDAVNNSSKFQNVLDEEGLLFVLTGKE
jgi:FMN-dependent NADH-azoreductase